MQKLQITWETTIFFLIYFGRMKTSSVNGTSHEWDEGMLLILPTLKAASTSWETEGLSSPKDI